MIIKIVRKYIELSQLGKTKPLLCEIDNDHGSLVPNVDFDDVCYLYCLACDFKRTLGMFSIQYMLAEILNNSDLDYILSDIDT